MKAPIDKTPENKNQVITNAASQAQGGSEGLHLFTDNRPETAQLQQLQGMANQFTEQIQLPIQKKKNNTGLPDNLKSGIENLSGMSMDDVKVHRNSDKPAQLNAHAYAQGTNIHLGSGQEKHLPHEAWHVVQQKQGRVKPTMQMKSNPSTALRAGVNVNDDAELEKEADVMGAKAVQMRIANPEPISDGLSYQLFKQGNVEQFYESSLKKTELKKSNQSTIQRQKVKIRGNDEYGIVSITIKTSRKGTGYAGGQGSHNTSYVTFIDMIKLRLEKVSFIDAATNLRDLYNEMLTFPGASIKNANFMFAKFQADAASQAAAADPSIVNLEIAADQLLEMRAKMPLTRTDDGKKTVGKEYYHEYLFQMERKAKIKGTSADEHKYYDHRYAFVWEMFDYQPTTSVDNQVITSSVLQHILSMQATYEELFAQRDLTISECASYFVDNFWTRFTKRMTKPSATYPNVQEKKDALRVLLLAF